MPCAHPAAIVSSGVTLRKCEGHTNISSGHLCTHLHVHLITEYIRQDKVKLRNSFKIDQPGRGYQERPGRVLEAAFSLMKITKNATAPLMRASERA